MWVPLKIWFLVVTEQYFIKLFKAPSESMKKNTGKKINKKAERERELNYYVDFDRLLGWAGLCRVRFPNVLQENSSLI